MILLIHMVFPDKVRNCLSFILQFIYINIFFMPGKGRLKRLKEIENI